MIGFVWGTTVSANSFLFFLYLFFACLWININWYKYIFIEMIMKIILYRLYTYFILRSAIACWSSKRAACSVHTSPTRKSFQTSLHNSPSKPMKFFWNNQQKLCSFAWSRLSQLARANVGLVKFKIPPLKSPKIYHT